MKQDGSRTHLRLLSYNIQTGLETRRHREYLTKGWHHLVPHPQRQRNLDRIASVLSQYDLVGLQEVDAGSLRSGFVDQTEYLAHRAGFPFWRKQINRNIGHFAQHSNGVLSHFKPHSVTDHRLPGLPGRGGMLCEFGSGRHLLAVLIVHLALGIRARRRQLDFIGELLNRYPYAVLMGDLNCTCRASEMQRLMNRTGLHEPACEEPTFPSWRPVRRFDHIMVSGNLKVSDARVLDYPLSDHLPISVEVVMPDHFSVAA
ncbi:MAG: endonuclease/exonuclease/phosphatase family protein [Pseudomonadota bacterium]